MEFNAHMQIGHCLTSPSSCHLTIPCSAERKECSVSSERLAQITHSPRSISLRDPATLDHRSLALLPRRLSPKAVKADRLDVLEDGALFNDSSFGVGKCKAINCRIAVSVRGTTIDHDAMHLLETSVESSLFELLAFASGLAF